ncbi:serine hydrolase [Fulvivirga sp. M361]|uniref:serine hydrolase n=1 Tax=Fulvivirga sp. M361 TaxID=2594266 RepID=UPI00117A4DA7|nr:serine hydrolase [Fulvivirga sp. M361]TRX49823.1 serine hydrolase [Fulvivirga sp. M361]
MIKIVFCASLAFFLAFYSVSAQPFSTDDQAIHWVDSVYNSLNLEERIGQLFVVQVYPDGNEQHHQIIQQLIVKQHVGGLIFMKGNAENLVNLNNRFQYQARIPLLAGITLTPHLKLPLNDISPTPMPLTLGAVRDNKLLYQLGQTTAFKMKRLGIHFGLVSIGKESEVFFGEIEQNVQKKTSAYMRGLQNNGVMMVAENFPGYQGNAALDTWQTSIPDNDQITFFQSLINESLMGVKTSGTYQVSTSQQDRLNPATLSSAIITDILQDKLGYEGLIFSDRLNQHDVLDQEPKKLEKAAFLAGNNILLFSAQIPQATKLIKKEIKKNASAAALLEKNVKRILLAKYTLGANSWQPKLIDNLLSDLNTASDEALEYTLYQHAIVAVRNDGDLLPLNTYDKQYFASLTLGKSKEFQRTLDSYAFFHHYKKSENNEKRLLSVLRNYDAVVIGVFDQPTQDDLFFLKDLAAIVPLVISYAGPISGLNAFKSFKHLLYINEATELTANLLAEACFGSFDLTGRLPVHVSDKLRLGSGKDLKQADRLGYAPPEYVKMDRQVLSRIDNIVEEAIEDQATPGAQVVVAKDGKIVFERSYGHYTYDSLKPVSRETIYDIASITKVAATLQVIMLLYEREVIDLDKKISVYLPELKGTNKENMIIRDILTHQAGLWPYVPFWKQTLEDDEYLPLYYSMNGELGFNYQVSPGLYSSQTIKDSVWNWVAASRLVVKKPREPYPYRYSDIGYYLMQRLIQKYINQPMEEFLQQNLYDPMGLTSLSYLPLCRFPLSRIAPTENDEYFRNTLVYGLVHDQGAALFGGVAGHAGLFSNATDLAKLMQMHLQGGKYGGQRFLLSGTLGTFTAQQYESNRRGMGWDKPAIAQWQGPTSRYASGKTFGHTGFTGTAVWADPEFNLVYVFLSNRIHPDAENRKLIKNNIRTRIQEVIYEAIWSYTQYGCTD